jgi:hypothetical protein
VLDAVAQARRLLVLLLLDHPLEVAAQPLELDGTLVGGRLLHVRGVGVADVLRGAVQPLEQRDDAREEDLVVVRAAEARLGLELVEGHAALGADAVASPRRRRGLLHQLLEEREDRGRLDRGDAVRFGALLAEVALRLLARSGDLGDVDARRLLLALLAETAHGSTGLRPARDRRRVAADSPGARGRFKERPATPPARGRDRRAR